MKALEKLSRIAIQKRLAFDKRYIGKNVILQFDDQETGNLYQGPHDKMMKELLDTKEAAVSKSWINKGGYSWRTLSIEQYRKLEKYRMC